MSHHIDHIFYINLDHRIDRRTEIETELGQYGLLGERYSAISTPGRGIVGCGYSHLHVLKLAKERGYRNVLILEDDFQFLVSKEVLEQSLQHFFDTEMTYDVLFLSYNVLESAEIPDCSFLRKVLDAQTASGYLVHGDYLDTLISLYEEAIPLLDQTMMHWIYANDQVWKTLQPSHRWYYFTTRLGKQRKSYSDNTEVMADLVV